MMRHQVEQVSRLWDEAGALLVAHWREIARYPDIPLAPDIQGYRAIEDSGQLRCYTVRDDERLVGYAVFIVRPNPHYCESIQANQDVIFLEPQYRRGMAGVRLIRFAEEQLRTEGVQVIYHHAKRTNRVGELLLRLGYELVDEVYAKRLDR